MSDEIKKRAADRSATAVRQAGAIGYDVVRRDDEFVERYCGPVIDRVIEADRARSESPPIDNFATAVEQARRLAGVGLVGMTRMTKEELAAIYPAPTELRPPAEHADKPWHWIRHGTTGEACPWQWLDGIWHTPIGNFVGSVEAAALECRPSYLGPAKWRDWSTEKGGDAGEYWAERWHETNLQSEARGRRIRELEAAMKHMQVVTPGAWCDADVVAMKARNAELEAENARLNSLFMYGPRPAGHYPDGWKYIIWPPTFMPPVFCEDGTPALGTQLFPQPPEAADPQSITTGAKVNAMPFASAGPGVIAAAAAAAKEAAKPTPAPSAPKPPLPPAALRGGDGVPR